MVHPNMKKQYLLILYNDSFVFIHIIYLWSTVKNDINTVQFLAQTDRFMSLDLNVSPRAARFNLS